MKKIVLLLIAVALLGYIGYEALMYYDDHFQYGRMRETPAVRPYEEPILKMEAGIVPVNGGEAILRVSAGIDLMPPFDLAEAEVINKGKAVYFTFCAQCHGKNFNGKGTVGQSFHPLPTNLRSSPVQDKAPGELFKSISYGIPGGRQPPLETTIAIKDRWHVVAFVKSLGGKE